MRNGAHVDLAEVLGRVVRGHFFVFGFFVTFFGLDEGSVDHIIGGDLRDDVFFSDAVFAVFWRVSWAYGGSV